MLSSASPNNVVESDFAGIREEFTDLTRRAVASEAGWAYAKDSLTPSQAALLGADVAQIMETVPPDRTRRHPATDPHQYRQGRMRGRHAGKLLGQSLGAVAQVAEEVPSGLKSNRSGYFSGAGEELALNQMLPWTVGRGHVDLGARRTGNVSAGPVRVRLHNRFGQLEVVEAESSLLIVMLSGTWHKFSNPSGTETRASASVAIN